MKTCTACGVSKDESEFNRDKQRRDGLHPSCKHCKSQDSKKRRAASPRKAHVVTCSEKRCPKCGVTDPASEFGVDSNNSGGLRARCIVCARIKTPEARAAEMSRGFVRRRANRDRVLAHYGGRCVCCGEERREFLAIDHINGGGGKHIKSIKMPLTEWLIKNGMPEGFRVLCHNCNMARGFYGTCPHEDAGKVIAVG